MVGPILHVSSNNNYVSTAIDRYSNGCEARSIMDDGTNVATIFIEGKIICRFESRYILNAHLYQKVEIDRFTIR
jgi:hypothetical protein